jgi:hypothetical protein
MSKSDFNSVTHHRWDRIPEEPLKDTLDVDVFSPPRQDWLAGTDAYLRR